MFPSLATRVIMPMRALSNVQVSGAAKGGLLNDAPSWHFKLVREAGNSGW